MLVAVDVGVLVVGNEDCGFVVCVACVGCTEGNARIKVHRAINELKTIFLTLEKQ